MTKLNIPIAYAGFPFLTAILLSCLLGLLVILFIPAQRKALIRWISAVFSGIPFLLTIILFITYDRSQGGLQFVEKVIWVKSLGIHYFNGADGFNLPLLLLTGIVHFTGVLTMWKLEERVKEFFALSFLLVMGVFGFFMSLDLFFLFVWFDVSLFPMYPLILIWGTTRREYGAMKLFLYLLAGSSLILPSLLYLFVKSGMNTFDLISLMQADTFTPFQQKLAFLLLYLGFGILAGVWPFHTWSPSGHVAAPTSVSMIHAGVLMKLGAFGILRVAILLCPLGWRYWAELMAVLAVIGIVYGVFVGLTQTDLKYVVAYSSVSHMGIVGLGLSTVTVGGLNGAVFQMFAHGIMTALLFSSVGYFYDTTKTKMIPELGGMSTVMPKASAYFILGSLAGMGVPGFANFWAEFTVFVSSLKIYPLRGVLAISSLVVSALFMLRVIQKTFYGPRREDLAHLPDISFGLGLPRIILILVLLLFGFFPSLMLDLIQTAAIPLMEKGPAMTWWPLIPEAYFLLVSGIFFALAMRPSSDARRAHLTALILTAGGVVISLGAVKGEGLFFSQVLRLDLFSQVFKIMLALGVFLIVCLCSELKGLEEKHHPEFYFLLALATLAIMILVSSVELLTIYVGLELTGYSLYLLVPLRKGYGYELEAGIKYFLTGASTSAVMLFGMAMLYGALGTTYLTKLAQVPPDLMGAPLVFTGLLFALCGFFFKLALFPFHLWAPGVYQGAANQVTAFLATSTKVAAIALILRLVSISGGGTRLVHLLSVLAIASMTLGNLSALVQKSLKRLLAYSAIAQAGYVLIGILSLNESGYGGAIFYALAYLIMNATCFLVVIKVADRGQDLEIDDLRGLHRRAPLLALALLLGFFSLGGLPPTIGFTGKFLIFLAAMGKGYFYLVLIGMINVVLSLYYYALVIKAAYFLPAEEDLPVIILSWPAKLLTVVMMMIIIGGGIFPAYFYKLAINAARLLH